MDAEETREDRDVNDDDTSDSHSPMIEDDEEQEQVQPQLWRSTRPSIRPKYLGF